MKFLGFDIDVFNLTYANKEYLWLLCIIPLMIAYYVYQAFFNINSVKTSSARAFPDENASRIMAFTRHNHILIYALSFTCFIIALARPQSPDEIERFKKKNIQGIDIVMALDVSLSMMAQDFKPNRLEASKKVALDFIAERPNDRIGLVVYEGEAYTQVPLTTDHTILTKLFSEVKSGMVDGGTAIGMGLAVATNRLRESVAKSKVIILLSDGVNNSGNIDPATAAELAKSYGIRVYTIGVGTEGTAKMPVPSMFGTILQSVPVEIDEESLKLIAKKTDGKYFRATDEAKLRQIYKEIDLLEKSKISEIEFKTDPPEKFHGFVLFGLCFLALDFLYRKTILASIHE